MAIGLIIIGDEILSGKRADKHFPKVVEALAERGLQRAWAKYVGDDPARITATLKRTLASADIVPAEESALRRTITCANVPPLRWTCRLPCMTKQESRSRSAWQIWRAKTASP